MTEPNPAQAPRLRELLRELHAELSRAEHVDDPAARALLQAVENDVHRVLSDEAPADARLYTRLKHAVERFEGRHPRLTVAVDRVLGALADVGL
jgi:predicted component of type VI protein secretion system